MAYSGNIDCPYVEYCGECKYEDSDKPCLRRPGFQNQLKLSHLPYYQWQNTELFPDEIDLDAFEYLAEIGETITDRVNTLGSRNLVICGQNMGNGKTAWAIKLMKLYLHDIGWKAFFDDKFPHAVFVPTSQYVMDAKSFDSNDPSHKRYIQLRDDADKADMVIWDDIGSAEYTRYDYINLLVPIERRILAGKFNIFTTNFTDYDDDLIARLGDRLANRVWETSDIVEFRGEGVRH